MAIAAGVARVCKVYSSAYSRGLCSTLEKALSSFPLTWKSSWVTVHVYDQCNKVTLGVYMISTKSTISLIL